MCTVCLYGLSQFRTQNESYSGKVLKLKSLPLYLLSDIYHNETGGIRRNHTVSLTSWFECWVNWREVWNFTAKKKVQETKSRETKKKTWL